MALTNSRITYGLSATAAATSINTSGDFTLGIDPTSLLLSADNGFSFGGCIYGAANTVTLDVANGSATGTTFVAGTAQVDTATAAGTITASGNATVVFTSSAVTGSPVTVSVAVTNGDTAAVWAGKVRTALSANTAIAAAFTISGTSTAIVATRKSETVRSDCPVSYYGNDSALNISLDNGTCTGITPATTSADTTTGVATSGAYILRGDGKDFEGNNLVELTEIRGCLVLCGSGAIQVSNTEGLGFSMEAGAVFSMGTNGSAQIAMLLNETSFEAIGRNTSFSATYLGA